MPGFRDPSAGPLCEVGYAGSVAYGCVSDRASRPPSERSRLLVALNSIETVDRALLYRLSRSDRWLDRLGAGRPETTGPVSAAALRSVRERLRRCDEIAEDHASQAARLGASLTTRVDPGYPPALLDLPLPPPVLYHRGALPTAPGISIVGSRRADSYGLETALMFARHLAARGLLVVSGLAVGIDSAAHRGALEAPGGRTVAVLGCGIDVEYPRGSARLANRIAEAGAVISELPLGARPYKSHFPMRNRIIAALGLGTLVVRATARSGSLITARLALELGRDVYALPGNIFDRRSVGPNSLIRDGALAAQHPRELIESLPFAVRQRVEIRAPEAQSPEPTGSELAPAARKILRRLSPGTTRTAEALAAGTEQSVSEVLGVLLELELAGWVRRYPGPAFGRRARHL